MPLLSLSLTHRTVGWAVLERLGARGAAPALARALAADPRVGEVLVVDTCNRVEVVLGADRFHAAADALAEHLTRLGVDDPARHPLRVDDDAVHHLLRVATGLDSLALGEPQVLGQVRAALRDAEAAGTVGHVVGPAVRAALAGARRVRAATGLDTVAADLVRTGLALAGLARPTPAAAPSVLVLGSGSLAGLTVARLHEAGHTDVTVLARTPRAADGWPVRTAPLAELPRRLATATHVVGCTGATEPLVHAAQLEALPEHARPVLLDLAVPRDIDPGTARHTLLVDLPAIEAGLAAAARTTAPDAAAARGGAASGADDGEEHARHEARLAAVAHAEQLVLVEVEEFAAERRARAMGPSIGALRRQADDVVAAELATALRRLHAAGLGAHPGLAAAVEAELARSLHRVSDKLLHRPLVRARAWAAEEDCTGSPARAAVEALNRLFDLAETHTVAAAAPGTAVPVSRRPRTEPSAGAVGDVPTTCAAGTAQESRGGDLP